MNTDFSKTKIASTFTHVLYLIVFASIIFSFRAITSIGLGVMLLTGIITNRRALKNLFQKNTHTIFVGGCILLFLLHLTALFYTTDPQQGWTDVRIKTGLALTPLAVCLLPYYGKNTRETLLGQYCLLLAIASLYCLCISFIDSRNTGLTTVFFYHELVSPIKQHAVYFSVLIAIGLIFLLEGLLKRNFYISRWLATCLVVYLSAFLFLLSSKLVIIFYVGYLVYYFFRLIKKPGKSRLAITGIFILCSVAITLLFVIRSPIRERFRDVIQGNIQIVTQESFTEGDYFNGLQFRLLQWRFVGEILTENKRWWLGVSPGDAQTMLNKKYLSKHMYAGDSARGDGGYLIYNTHNQFLQTLLQNGIAGLVVLVAICVFTMKMVIEQRDRVAIIVTSLLLAWLFTESVFETQYGIVIFTLFPLFICENAIKAMPVIRSRHLKTNFDI
jgi:O-antigen ligase